MCKMSHLKQEVCSYINRFYIGRIPPPFFNPVWQVCEGPPNRFVFPVSLKVNQVLRTPKIMQLI